MKYSVIICYRDRKEHLEILIPRLLEVFESEEAEIIIVEQNDGDKFMRGNVFNAGAQVAKGDILVFHDVDHYPIDTIAVDELSKEHGAWWAGSAKYEPPEGVDMWLPIKRVVYVDENLDPLPLEEVPSGYRHFSDSVDDNFYGGISVFRREAFFKINGALTG